MLFSNLPNKGWEARASSKTLPRRLYLLFIKLFDGSFLSMLHADGFFSLCIKVITQKRFHERPVARQIAATTSLLFLLSSLRRLCRHCWSISPNSPNSLRGWTFVYNPLFLLEVWQNTKWNYSLSSPVFAYPLVLSFCLFKKVLSVCFFLPL